MELNLLTMLIKIHAIPESDGEWLTLGFLITLNVVGMVGWMGCHASTPSLAQVGFMDIRR